MRSPGVQGFWRNVLSFLDGDELIGAHVFTAHGDAFAAGPAQPIDARFQRLLQEQAGTAIVDDYRLTGEIVAIRAGPLAYETVRRSAEYATPAAAGAPAICLVPALGVQNIVYRDTDGRLHELWRDRRADRHDEPDWCGGGCARQRSCEPAPRSAQLPIATVVQPAHSSSSLISRATQALTPLTCA